MKPSDFSVHLTNFLTHYLAAQRNLSPNTIKAYRDVFTLLLRFCRDVQGIALERLRLEKIDVSLVETSLTTWRARENLLLVHEIIGLLPCMLSSGTFRPKNQPICFNVKKSSPFPCDDTLAPPSRTFRKRSWLTSWRSQTPNPGRSKGCSFVKRPLRHRGARSRAD